MTVLPGDQDSNNLIGDGQNLSGSSGQDSLRQAVREAKQRIEAKLIMKALEKHRWNRRRTAEALQISYRSLMYKMRICKLREETSGQPPQE